MEPRGGGGPVLVGGRVALVCLSLRSMQLLFIVAYYMPFGELIIFSRRCRQATTIAGRQSRHCFACSQTSRWVVFLHCCNPEKCL